MRPNREEFERSHEQDTCVSTNLAWAEIIFEWDDSGDANVIIASSPILRPL